MRLHEAHPQRERLCPVGLEELLCPTGLIERSHVVFMPRIGQFVGIQPDARRVLERTPWWFGCHAVRYGLGLHVLGPRASEFLLREGHIESVETWLGRPVEMHFAVDRSRVACFFQLARQGRLVFRQWRR